MITVRLKIESLENSYMQNKISFFDVKQYLGNAQISDITIHVPSKKCKTSSKLIV